MKERILHRILSLNLEILVSYQGDEQHVALTVEDTLASDFRNSTSVAGTKDSVDLLKTFELVRPCTISSMAQVESSSKEKV